MGKSKKTRSRARLAERNERRREERLDREFNLARRRQIRDAIDAGKFKESDFFDDGVHMHIVAEDPETLRRAWREFIQDQDAPFIMTTVEETPTGDLQIHSTTTPPAYLTE